MKTIVTVYPCDDGGIALHLTDSEGDMVHVSMTLWDARELAAMLNNASHTSEQQPRRPLVRYSA